MRRSDVVVAAVLSLCAMACTPEEVQAALDEDFPRFPTNLGGTQPTFRVNSLTISNCGGINHNAVTGDDRGGIALSNNVFFYSGDIATGLFDRHTGATQGAVSPPLDGLVSDFATGAVYNLVGSSGELITRDNWSTSEVVGLRRINDDGSEGAFLRLRHEIPFTFGAPVGLFSGWGRIVLYVNQHFLNIDTGDGTVTDLGVFPNVGNQACESWAYWGVAEFFDDTVHILWKLDAQNIYRRSLDIDFNFTHIISMPITDMCAFTVAPDLNRWYFHYEGTSSILPAVTTETAGACDASFLVP